MASRTPDFLFGQVRGLPTQPPARPPQRRLDRLVREFKSTTHSAPENGASSAGGVGVVVEQGGQDPVPAGGRLPGLVGDSHGELGQPGCEVVQPRRPRFTAGLAATNAARTPAGVATNANGPGPAAADADTPTPRHPDTWASQDHLPQQPRRPGGGHDRLGHRSSGFRRAVSATRLLPGASPHLRPGQPKPQRSLPDRHRATHYQGKTPESTSSLGRWARPRLCVPGCVDVFRAAFACVCCHWSIFMSPNSRRRPGGLGWFLSSAAH